MRASAGQTAVLLYEGLDRRNVDGVEPADDLAGAIFAERCAAARTNGGAVIDDFVWIVAGGSEMRLVARLCPAGLGIRALGLFICRWRKR